MQWPPRSDHSKRNQLSSVLMLMCSVGPHCPQLTPVWAHGYLNFLVLFLLSLALSPYTALRYTAAPQCAGLLNNVAQLKWFLLWFRFNLKWRGIIYTVRFCREFSLENPLRRLNHIIEGRNENNDERHKIKVVWSMTYIHTLKLCFNSIFLLFYLIKTV